MTESAAANGIKELELILNESSHKFSLQFEYQFKIVNWMMEHLEEQVILLIANDSLKDASPSDNPFEIIPYLMDDSLCVFTSEEENHAAEHLIQTETINIASLSIQTLLEFSISRFTRTCGIMFNAGSDQVWISSGLTADACYEGHIQPFTVSFSMKDEDAGDLLHQEWQFSKKAELLLKQLDAPHKDRAEQEKLDLQLFEQLITTATLVDDFTVSDQEIVRTDYRVKDDYLPGQTDMAVFTNVKELRKSLRTKPENILFFSIEDSLQRLMHSEDAAGIAINPDGHACVIDRHSAAMIKTIEAIDRLHDDSEKASVQFAEYYSKRYGIK